MKNVLLSRRRRTSGPPPRRSANPISLWACLIRAGAGSNVSHKVEPLILHPAPERIPSLYCRPSGNYI